VFANEERFDIEAGFFRNVDEADAEIASFRGWPGSVRGHLSSRLQFRPPKQRASQRNHIFKGENERGSAQRAKE
jgi:hypothetical protein